MERKFVMLYLMLAIASSVMVSVCMRLSQKHVTNEMGMFMANYAVCILLSVVFMNQSADYGIAQSVIFMIGLGILSGILYLVSFVFLKFNMQHNGIVLASTFMKLGVLIPTIMAIVIFHELPTWTQLLGIILSLVAIVMIHFEKDAMKRGNKKIWLLVLLILNGFTDSMANIYDKIGDTNGKDSYLLVTFLTAFILAFVLSIRGKQKITKKDLIFGMLIGVPNYFSARFLLMALNGMAAVLVYPMYSVVTMIVISVVGIFVFKESVSKKKLGAIALIICALCLLNL